MNLKYAYVTLNSDRYPAVDDNLSFANQRLSRVYSDAAFFGVKFFRLDELITQSNITPSDYKTLYPFSRSMSASRKKRYFRSLFGKFNFHSLMRFTILMMRCNDFSELKVLRHLKHTCLTWPCFDVCNDNNLLIYLIQQ